MNYLSVACIIIYVVGFAVGLGKYISNLNAKTQQYSNKTQMLVFLVVSSNYC